PPLAREPVPPPLPPGNRPRTAALRGGGRAGGKAGEPVTARSVARMTGRPHRGLGGLGRQGCGRGGVSLAARDCRALFLPVRRKNPTTCRKTPISPRGFPLHTHPAPVAIAIAWPPWTRRGRTHPALPVHCTQGNPWRLSCRSIAYPLK